MTNTKEIYFGSFQTTKFSITLLSDVSFYMHVYNHGGVKKKTKRFCQTSQALHSCSIPVNSIHECDWETGSQALQSSSRTPMRGLYPHFVIMFTKGSNIRTEPRLQWMSCFYFSCLWEHCFCFSCSQNKTFTQQLTFFMVALGFHKHPTQDSRQHFHVYVDIFTWGNNTTNLDVIKPH